MTVHYADDWLTVLHGDVRDELRTLPDESVHCVITSPPYWGLRDYGQPDQLGLEPIPEQYVENMVAVFREVRRVLRSDGTLWLNLGDSYAASQTGTLGDKITLGGGQANQAANLSRPSKLAPGLKPKDLVGIPWRVAFALQADGWYLRSDVIWSKPNPMPESVTDRPTKSHEYLFLLSKSARYYFDADAVREPPSISTVERWHGDPYTKRDNGGEYTRTLHPHGGTGEATMGINPAGRNIRSVWTIATAPYPGAHFATFPPKLVEPCIKAGTSEKGVCPECGAPWERVVEKSFTGRVRQRATGGLGTEIRRETHGLDAVGGTFQEGAVYSTTGWRLSCGHHDAACDEDPMGGHVTSVPATVLDIFAGSGTTGMVAQSLSRRAVLIDLNVDYLGQLMERNREIPLGLESA